MHSTRLSVVLLAALVTALGACATEDDGDFIDRLPVSVLERSLDVPELPAVPTCAGLTPHMPRWDGFVGSYGRVGLAVDDELVSLHVRTYVVDPEWIGVTGKYDGLVRRDGLPTSERGSYTAVPDNPAIGPALFLQPEGTPEGSGEVYWVIGHRRNWLGRVDRLCLVLDSGPEQPAHAPFLLKRLGW